MKIKATGESKHMTHITVFVIKHFVTFIVVAVCTTTICYMCIINIVCYYFIACQFNFFLESYM